MLYLNYLFLIFEWSACKLAGQAKCSFHYKQAFNLFNLRKLAATVGSKHAKRSDPPWRKQGWIDLVTVLDAILTSRQTCEKLQCLHENLKSNNYLKTVVLSHSHAQASIDLLCEYITSHKNLWKTSTRGYDYLQESCDPSLDKSTICYARRKASWKYDLRLDISKIKARFLHHQWNLNSSFLITTVFLTYCTYLILILMLVLIPTPIFIPILTTINL